jgi:HK97 family phage major capsid protein
MDSKEIRFQIGKLLVDQQNIALAGFNAESRSKFDKIQKDVDSLEADAARLEAMEARSREAESFTRSARPGANGGLDVEQNVEQRKKTFNGAFRQYARHGYGALNAEQRDLVTTSDTTGGALIPQMFDGTLFMAQKFYGPTALQVKQKVTENSGDPLKVSIGTDMANGLTLLATEGTSSPAETDLAFQSRIVDVDTVTGGLVLVSVQELEDSSFDLDSFLRDSFGVRYARGLERAVTLGLDSAGTTLPNQVSDGWLALRPWPIPRRRLLTASAGTI